MIFKPNSVVLQTSLVTGSAAALLQLPWAVMSVEHLPLFEVFGLNAGKQLPTSVDTYKFVSNDWMLF